MAKKREHLSIGEVLGLLENDFPDLTITKIRFLESQGLIAPERTPSGYRKFYKFDIERLRWVLRQQKENFLPLKVIKNRLDGADGKDSDGDAPNQTQLSLGSDPATSDPPPVWMADHARVTGKTQVATDRSTKQKSVTKETAPTDNSGTTGSAIKGGSDAQGSKAAEAGQGVAKPETKQKTKEVSAVSAKAGSAKPSGSASEDIGTAGDVGRTTKPTDESDSPTMKSAPKKDVASKGEAVAKKPAPEAKPKKTKTMESVLDAGMTGVSMSIGELAGASGLTENQLETLESFGLLSPSQVGTEPIYSEEALIVARQASVFFSLGLEARHLRAFKIAADRESSIYEQLVVHLVKQRNPQARQQTSETLHELARAGNAIHGALLREALSAYLDN